jgi:hypothetical protein
MSCFSLLCLLSLFDRCGSSKSVSKFPQSASARSSYQFVLKKPLTTQVKWPAAATRTSHCKNVAHRTFHRTVGHTLLRADWRSMAQHAISTDSDERWAVRGRGPLLWAAIEAGGSAL